MSVPNNTKDVFIVIPAFNEDAVIKSVVEEISHFNYSIIVVDDGSKISLLPLLRKMPVYFIRHKINLGQGAALQTGIEYALSKKAEYIVTFDADGQHDAGDIQKLLDSLISNKADIAFGSRFIENSTENMPKGRKFILYLARIFNFFITGLFLSDAHNGLRAMNRKAASLIKIKQNGMAHASEILVQVKSKNLRFVEIPVKIKYTTYSTKKGQTGWSGFRIFFDLLLNKLFR